MIAYKVWLETRGRFILGALIITCLCLFFVIGNPLILKQWASDAIAHPEWRDPVWFPQAKSDYGFFLWHFLYNYLLQLLWVIFVVLLGLGGLLSEHEKGTSLFTLSLPVTREELYIKRVITGYGVACALAFVPCLILPLSNLLIDKHYSLDIAISHAVFFICGGMVFYALAIFINTLVKGEFISYSISISLVILFYFFFQPYADQTQKPGFINYINLPGFMAGKSSSNFFYDFQWSAFAACIIISLSLIYFSYRIILKRDF
jgi:ABC-type transport system involved in multi-copper enzyme maturation permease subunit